MIKKIIRTAIVFLFTAVLTVSAVTIFITDPVAEEETEAAEIKTEETESAWDLLAGKENVCVTILGDSIARGYSRDKSLEISPYGNLVMEELAEEEGVTYDIVNYAENGLDSYKMNAEILTDEAVCSRLASSDLVFITVGSNDLLNEFKKAVQEILDTETKIRSVSEATDVLGQSVKENPMLILKVADAVQSWDYPSFEEQWTEMMKTVCELKKEDARIVVTNIYNPVENLELPSTMNRVTDEVIRNMNDIIEAHAAEYGYQVVDLFHSDVYDHVQDDGLHPDQEGQQLIADRILDISSADRS